MYSINSMLYIIYNFNSYFCFMTYKLYEYSKQVYDLYINIYALRKYKQKYLLMGVIVKNYTIPHRLSMTCHSIQSTQYTHTHTHN